MTKEKEYEIMNRIDEITVTGRGAFSAGTTEPITEFEYKNC